jgi:ubiquinone/menaquinone biosynthesis C-methylase UbiE
MELSKQYDPIVSDYISLRKKMNRISDTAFLECITPFISPTGKALDFGCGSGDLIQHISKYMECAGIDTSSEMVSVAKKVTGADIREEDFAHTSFADNSCTLVVSKWAMQTSREIDPIYSEARRVLVSGGHFIFLVVHPFRHFLEKKKVGKDYFQQEIVQSVIFDGTITVEEPTHTMQEYLSDFFLKNFSLVAIKEGAEFPAAEQLGGDIYPTYLIIAAQKK